MKQLIVLSLLLTLSQTMKLIQRIALKYYHLKISTIEIFSVKAAGNSAFKLFCTPYTRKRKLDLPDAFLKAKKLYFSFHSYHIHGFEWIPTKSNGKKLLICHGFDSYSYKFARYIEPLLAAGYTIYAFDAPAHGLSSGKQITALLYSNLILEVNKTFGDFDVIMAHSFGCIAASLAVEKTNYRPKKLVLFAPATETTRSIIDFIRLLKLSPAIKNEIEQIIIEINEKPATWYSVARVVKDIQIPILWIHDKFDPITPYEDMSYLEKSDLKHLNLIITENLGHSLYRNSDVARQVINWLAD